jgi:hypothetical protein
MLTVSLDITTSFFEVVNNKSILVSNGVEEEIVNESGIDELLIPFASKELIIADDVFIAA